MMSTWIARGAHIYVGETQETIAIIPGVRCDEPTSKNALLMAAAPDLLQACKGILQNLEDGEMDKDGEGEEYSDVTALREAICKAEGL